MAMDNQSKSRHHSAISNSSQRHYVPHNKATQPRQTTTTTRMQYHYSHNHRKTHQFNLGNDSLQDTVQPRRPSAQHYHYKQHHQSHQPRSSKRPNLIQQVQCQGPIDLHQSIRAAHSTTRPRIQHHWFPRGKRTTRTNRFAILPYIQFTQRQQRRSWRTTTTRKAQHYTQQST